MLKTIPDRLFVTLKYNDRYALSATTGQLAIHAFGLNNLHDPDYSGTGHQPLYYDQLVNSLEGNGLFHKWRVHACSWVIRFVNSDSNVEHSMFVLPITHGNTITAADDIDAVCENPYAQRRILSANASGRNQATVKGRCMIKRLEGVSNLNISPSYQSEYGSSPNFIPKLYIGGIAMDETTAMGNVYADVTLYYKAELFDRIYRSSTN